MIIPHYMQKDLQWYAGVPVFRGISSYSEPADWGTYELNHYELAALGWAVNEAVDGVIKKFCDARYGDQSKAIFPVFLGMESVVPKYCSLPNTSLKDAERLAKAQIGMATFANLLDRAGKSEKDKNRLSEVWNDSF